MTQNKRTFHHILNDHARNSLKKKLHDQCDRSEVEFVYFVRSIRKSIVASKKKYFISIFDADLINNDYDFFKQLNSFLIEHNKQLLLCTDNFHSIKDFSNIKIICHDVLLGINHLHVDPDCYGSLDHNHPKKLFNCFIQRTESVRQSWLYFLHYYKLVDQGYVSYLCFQDNSYSNFKGPELYDYIHRNYKLGELAHFDDAYHALRPLMPFQNFIENGKLDDKILDSKYSLVLDTYAIDDHSEFRFVSEKIYRSLMLPCCHLFFVQKGTLEKLADVGIEISPSNLAFDQLDWVQRQQKILEILTKDSDEYNFKYLKSQALHNYNLLKNMYDKNIDQFYDEIIETAQAKFN